MLLKENRTKKAQILDCEFDLETGELARQGIRMRLEGQPARVLAALIRADGNLVSRQELIAELWPGEVAGNFDRRLDKAIAKLRAGINDNPSAPRFIETVPRRGYRLIASVSITKSPPAEPVDGAADADPDTVHSPAGPRHIPLVLGRFWRSLSRLAVVLTLTIVLGVILAASLVLPLYSGALRSPQQNSNHESAFKVIPITSAPGSAESPVFSPDGREIAYLWDGADRQRDDVYALLIGADAPLRLTFSKAGFVGPPAWSTDGQQVAFSRCDGKNNGVFVVPALGGEERMLTTVDCLLTRPGRVAWLNDGNQMLIVDRCGGSGPFGVVMLSIATGDKRCLTNYGALSGLDVGLDFALSPDGKTVAFTPAKSGKPCEIYSVSTDGGIPLRLTNDAQCWGKLMWTPDSKAIIFSSSRTTDFSIWRVSAAGGQLEPEVEYDQRGDLSKDGRRLLYSDQTTTDGPEIWRADMAVPGGQLVGHRKLIASQEEEKDAQPSPDGSEVVWMCWRTGIAQIWKGKATGESPRQLTHMDGYSGTPRWSPDGKSIVFDSLTKSGTQIFVMDSEGRNPHPITQGPADNVVPSWSRDGRSIYFASSRTGRWEVWKISLSDKREIQITTHGGFDPFESQDGNTVYFSRFDQAGIWKVSVNGGQESVEIADKPGYGYWGDWAVTRTGIYVLNTDAAPESRIEFYDFATRRSSPVFSVGEKLARLEPSLSATADGKTVFYTQYDGQSMIKMRQSYP